MALAIDSWWRSCCKSEIDGLWRGLAIQWLAFHHNLEETMRTRSGVDAKVKKSNLSKALWLLVAKAGRSPLEAQMILSTEDDPVRYEEAKGMPNCVRLAGLGRGHVRVDGKKLTSRNPRVVKEEFVARALELRDLNPRGLLPKEFVDKIARRVFRLKKNQHHRYVGLCDPCSNSAINPNVKAETVYDLAQDGLAQTDWGSFALVNPPFRQTKVWANRAIAEADRGNNVILLTTTTRTTPEWSLEVRDRKFPVFVFDATQFSFLDYDRSAPFEIMIVCLSADEGVQCRFVETFIEDVLQRRGGFRQS